MMNRTTVSTSINNDQMVNNKLCIKNEVQGYLINTNNNNDLSPLNGGRRMEEKSKYGYNCAKVVGSSGNFHSKQVPIHDLWISGYCRAVESHRSTYQKASIPLEQY